MIKFGTDGWRAVISEGFTFDNVRTVSQAVADYFNSRKVQSARCKVKDLNLAPRTSHLAPSMVVGYDTRFMSNRYAELVAEVLMGNGIKVILSNQPIPTPIVSVTIKERRLDGGIMITASHNPPFYNGIKIKSKFAGSLDPEATTVIEGLLNKNPLRSIPISDARGDSMFLEIADLRSPYLRYVRSFVDMKVMRKSRIKVALDAMHGAASGYLIKLLKDTPIRITSIRQDYDPLFGGCSPEPLSYNLKELIALTRKGDFDIGLANDGDGDRIGAVTPSGRSLTAGELLSLLIVHLVEDKGLKGGVVKTISNTSLIEGLCSHYNLKLFETPVGFKHIAKLMREEDILSGGEESGGIGVKGYIPERDGTLLGLLLLEMVAMRKKDISKIMQGIDRRFGRFYYLRQDIQYPNELKARLFTTLKDSPPTGLLGSPVEKIDSYDGFKMMTRAGHWLLLRLSGTEPILRIYAESHELKKSKQLIELGKKIANSIL